MIFVFIAGSYTPFALLALPQDRGGCCSGSCGAAHWPGVALKMLWPSAPRWLGVPLYILLGWVAVVVHRADHAGCRRGGAWCC